jgi:hypothetical protein
MLRVLTANRLGDGRVVFLTTTGDWSPDLNAACTAEDDDAAAELMAVGELAETNCVVTGPYLIDVTNDQGEIRAAAIREAIRATGPTITAGQF